MISKLDYTIESMDYDDLCNIPDIDNLKNKSLCGIYFLLYDKKIVYVGQSIHILSRIKGHSNKLFDDVFYLECDTVELDRLETHYIVAFNPKYNKTHDAIITVNKYRLENKKLTKFEKHCIEYDTAVNACIYLNLKY